MAKFTVGAFLPSRLTLGKCRGELAARVADALTALTDMIRDGRRWPEEHDRNGPLLNFADGGLSPLNNPLYQYEIECIWGWGWLRESPDFDIGASTIIAPDLNLDPGPELSEIQKTLRGISRLYAPPPPAPRPRWIPTRLMINTADFSRLLRSFALQEVPPQPEEQPVTVGDQGNSRPKRKGRPRDIRNRVISEMQKDIDEGKRTLPELLNLKRDSLAEDYNTSVETVDRALEDLTGRKNTHK